MSNQQQNYTQNQIDLIKQSDDYYVNWDGSLDYVRVTVYEDLTDQFVGRYYSNKYFDSGAPQVEVYTQNDKIYVKPNEILDANYVAGGNYKLQFDFLRNIFDYSTISSIDTLSSLNSQFVITEISPSRKEIRVLAKKDGNIDIPFTDNQDSFNSLFIPGGNFSYDWVLTFEREKSIAINNITFDSISKPTQPSLIIRLNKPLPISFIRLDKVNIEKEVINTQTQNIIYVSNITTIDVGAGLEPDESVWTSQIVNTIDEGQNYNQLMATASFTENTVSDIQRKRDKDINLNIDFNEFKNHTMFGSAVTKLENFKTKVGKIQGQLSVISSSLNITSSMTGSYIKKQRENAFSEIHKIEKTFTPYEKFLYFDNQSQTTASAPGIGINYASSVPVNIGSSLNGTDSSTHTIKLNHDGFKIVHEIKPNGTQRVPLFSDKYFIHEPPFFSYTGSIYLSFLMKASDEFTDNANNQNQFQWINNNNGIEGVEGTGFYTPAETFHSSSILRPQFTSSKYQRFVLETSMSHWRPTGSGQFPEIIDTSLTASDGWSGNLNTYYNILSSSTQVENAHNSASAYSMSLDTPYSQYGTVFTGSNVPFYGSVLPAGELFRIYFKALDNSSGGTPVSSSYITDVKISLENPVDAYPFSFIYPTGSDSFDNWYSTMSFSASQYDDNNIHSLYKNIPPQVATGDDAKTFLNMWGEHFDGVRNYIDTYKTFYKRSYQDESDSMPTNLLPILGDNLGWELINPFSGSLSEYFSTLTGSLSTTEDITHNTWKKVINNLVYVYKSKGTHNSLRALLNIYGYPPDLIGVSEYGGSMEDHNPVVLNDEYTTLPQGLSGFQGNISYIKEPSIYRTMKFYGNGEKVLKFDWRTNDADGDTIEFTMIPKPTTTKMTLLESQNTPSSESLWDLRYIPSASTAVTSSTRGKLEFRLNCTHLGTGSLDDLPTSSSTEYFDIGNDKIFNVVVGSSGQTPLAGTGQTGVLTLVSSKKDDTIDVVTTGSLVLNSLVLGGKISVSNATAGTVNFFGTGSRHPLSASNLYVGGTFNGELADIKLWKTMPSASKIKQHTLNPNSVVGNNFNSLENDLIWRFRLSENSPSGSSITLKDANSNNIKDYSRSHNMDVYNNTFITRVIDTYKFSPKTDGFSHKNSNMITVDMDKGKMISELSPLRKTQLSNFNVDSNHRRETSYDVDFTKSPVDKVDRYLTDILADKDITQYYSKWEDLYKESYEDLDALREKIMAGVSIDINKYINTQAQLFNPFIIEAIEALLPARVKLKKGVTIKQNILERTKVRYKRASLQTIPVYTGDITDMWDFSTSTYLDFYSGILDDKPDISTDFIEISAGEITSEDLYDYSINYLPLYEFSEIKLYEDLINFGINHIELFNFDVINKIKEENFTINYIDMLTSIISNYDVEINKKSFLGIKQAFTPANKSKLYNFSMVKLNPFESNILNLYNDYVDFGIEYTETYKTNLPEWEYHSFAMEYSEILKTNLVEWEYQTLLAEYLKTINTDIDEWKYQQLSMLDLKIHDISVNEWEYQSFKVDYLPIYESNEVINFDSNGKSYGNYTEIYTEEEAAVGIIGWGGTPSDDVADYDNGIVTLTDTAGLQKAYMFDKDGGGNTGEEVASNVLYVQIIGHTTYEEIRNELNIAIAHANGHNGSILTEATSKITRFTQAVAGFSGNTHIGLTSLGSTAMSISSHFVGGVDEDSKKFFVKNTDQLTLSYQDITESDLDRYPYESFSMINSKVYEEILENWTYQSFSIDYTNISETNLENWTYQDFNTEYIKVYEDNILNWEYRDFNTNYNEVYEQNIDVYPYQSFGMENISPVRVDNYEIQELSWTDTKPSPTVNWGTTINDTWIMNMHASRSDGTHNTGYYNDEVINFMIGEFEHQSGSRKRKRCGSPGGVLSQVLTDDTRLCEDILECQADDYKCFTNVFVYDDGRTNDVYQAYMVSGSNPLGIKGKPLGKTTFISTGSSGEIIYPSNHYIHYHTTKDQLRHLYYRKTPSEIIVVDNNNHFQTSSYGRVQFNKDLFPSTPVYSIDVEGSDTKTILRVENVKDRPGVIQSFDQSDKFRYDGGDENWGGNREADPGDGPK